ncbi:MAG: molecular chaperone TorD family protein [Caldilineaceae bacterium]|nr:molecular chaperone TorD family protein [Caldilineaceae bacterium]
MNPESSVRRAQIYGFLSAAFLYPQEAWAEDLPALGDVLAECGVSTERPLPLALSLPDLQERYRQSFGVAGSLCYETEYGLPHEFRQSQELADLTGFYRAFGFDLGADVRERPDHIAVELEFMHILTLKETYALMGGKTEEAVICQEAQASFLADHLAHWLPLFAQSLLRNGGVDPYLTLARMTQVFVEAEVAALQVETDVLPLHAVQHTPFDPDFNCADCALANTMA